MKPAPDPGQRGVFASSRTARHRALAAALAITLTLGPLLALRALTSRTLLPRSTGTVSYLSLPSLPVQSRREEQPRRAAPAVPGPAVPAPRRPALAITVAPLAAAPPPSATATPAAAEAQGATADAPDPAASAPIRLDPATIRAANRASKSPLASMAEAGGAGFGDPVVSGDDKFAGAVGRTGKENCLGPAPGGSLLSIFVIPYKLASGRCR